METEIWVALISAAAVVVAALVPFLVQSLRAARGRRYRESHSIPNILGSWLAKWTILEPAPEAGAEGADGPPVYTEDLIELERWGIARGQFEGAEIGTKKEPDGTARKIDYLVHGEVGQQKIATIHWRHRDYPDQGHMGSAIVRLSVDSRHMEGYWIGIIQEGDMVEGSVTLEKQSDVN